MEWRHSVSPRPEKFRVHKSGGKFLTSIFWYLDGLLLIDYLPNGQTVNAEYYLSLLLQLNDILKEKTPLEDHQAGLVLERLFPGSHTAKKKLAYLGFQCLDHPPYSPYLAPSDYLLFLGLI